MLGALTWSSIDRVAQQGVQFLIGIVLARLLSPTDYGLMGMVMIFAGLSYVLVESGFNYALVRTKDLTPQHTNTIFYTNLAISWALYLLLFYYKFLNIYFHHSLYDTLQMLFLYFLTLTLLSSFLLHLYKILPILVLRFL